MHVDLELVDAAGDHVQLAEELGHVERVDDVIGVQPDVDGLVDRHDHLRTVLAGAREAQALVLVVEGPLPLEAGHVDGDRRVRGDGVDLAAARSVETTNRTQHDHRRDGRPEDLQHVVAVALARQLRRRHACVGSGSRR